MIGIGGWHLEAESDDLDECVRILGQIVDLAFITNSENGCYVCEKGEVVAVSGFPVKPIDTVGAGDAFAGGVLYGLTHGMTSQQAARWGNYIASRVVEINGPRLEGSLKEHLKSIVGE